MHLLLVGAWPELANQLVALPARVSLLQQPKSVDAREQEWAHRYVEVEYGEVDAAVAVAERIHHEDPVDVVVGFREFALPAVAANGHRTGPCHVELILTDEGPAIVEINRRLGGDRIWELVRLATGRDIMAESLWDAAGAEPPLIGTRSAAAAIRFLTPAGPATVADELPRDAAIGVPGFLRGVISVPGPGAEVEPASSSLGRFGYVLVSAADAESAAAAAEQAQARVLGKLFVPRS